MAITLLVKNPSAAEQGRIRFHDIGDYRTREEKLAIIASFGSIGGIEREGAWRIITPDEHGDWLGQRDNQFSEYIPLGDKKPTSATLFSTHSRGIETRRDAWCYNASRQALNENICKMAEVYNTESARFVEKTATLSSREREGLAPSIVTKDPTRISWTPNLLRDVENGMPLKVNGDFFIEAIYRPFSKTWAFSEKQLIWSRYRVPSFFPNRTAENRVIIIHGPGEHLAFTTLMSSSPSDVHALHGGQCFPRYLYDQEAPRNSFTCPLVI